MVLDKNKEIILSVMLGLGAVFLAGVLATIILYLISIVTDYFSVAYLIIVYLLSFLSVSMLNLTIYKGRLFRTIYLIVSIIAFILVCSFLIIGFTPIPIEGAL